MRLAAHDIREARLRQVFTYWDGKRAGRAMPARADIDPVEIPRLLGYLYLLDVAPDLAQSRFRLYGTALTDFFGTDRTGQRLVELSPEHMDRLLDEHGRAAAGAAVYLHGAQALRGHERLTYHRLLLPLSRDGSNVDMLLGAVDFDLTPAESLPRTVNGV